jgi:PKD repeat protein
MIQCDGLSCTFDGRNSSDRDGHIIDYAWELSSVDFPSGAVVNHTYDQGGTYQVSLTVTDNRSDTDNATQELRVSVPEPDPITFSGSGDQATDFFTTDFRLLEVHLSHDGQSNFIVWLIDEEGNKEENFANKIGSYEASRYFNPKPGEKYLLEVQADGAWEIRIEQPRPDRGAPMPVNLSGVGDTAYKFLSYEEGLARFDMTFSGEWNFIVWLYSKDGTKVELLANEVGEYQGSTTARIPSDGIYALDIVASGSDSSGDWSISSSQ